MGQTSTYSNHSGLHIERDTIIKASIFAKAFVWGCGIMCSISMVTINVAMWVFG